MSGAAIRSIDAIAKHADWVDEWKNMYELTTAEQVQAALQTEIGKTFAKILGCAGVYKNDDDFMRFIEVL